MPTNFKQTNKNPDTHHCFMYQFAFKIQEAQGP